MTLLRGLTRLTLADLPRGLSNPSYVTFRTSYCPCRQLEYLKLDGVFPVVVQEFEYGGITLSALVIDHDSSYVGDFFLIFCAPHTHTPSFETSRPITRHGRQIRRRAAHPARVLRGIARATAVAVCDAHAA